MLSGLAVIGLLYTCDFRALVGWPNSKCLLIIGVLGKGFIGATVGSLVLAALLRDLEARLARLILVVFAEIAKVLVPLVTLSEQFFLLLLHSHVAGQFTFYFTRCHSDRVVDFHEAAIWRSHKLRSPHRLYFYFASKITLYLE